jgi:acetoin utilization deacetylase AcuC-like enzyme
MIKAFYAPEYSNSAEFSMAKLRLIAEQVGQEGLAELVKPDTSAIVDKLVGLHHPDYVTQFIYNMGELATSNGFDWSKELREAVLFSNAGMVAGAKTAMDEGIAANIGQGYHHARYERGAAFCTFNGLALVASENPDKKVFVLDCDEHQGDGTTEFATRLDNLYNYSIFGTRMNSPDALLTQRTTERWVTGWDEYEATLWEALLKVDITRPDLVIYQAGVDCYKNDGMGQAGLRSSELITRDEIVFQFLKDAGIPCLFVMAGGYGEHAVFHHTRTFTVAAGIYGR